MRVIFILVLLGIFGANNPVHAQQANKCKDCRDHLKVCTANYSAKTCKSEYEICMKACRQK